jgi:uncharacterized protein YdeI (YjbR/CyaY-like superfamily)
VVILDYQEEVMALFKELTPENQANLLLYTRLAHLAECSVKKSLTSLQDIPTTEIAVNNDGK